MSLASIALMVLASFTLAGCAGSPEAAESARGPAATEPDIQFDESTGGVDGVVTDDQLQPLAGAEITLDGSIASSSDEAGQFRFSFVSPGDHSVAAAKAGYEGASISVSVVAGQVAPVRLALPVSAALAQYYETRVEEGFMACGIAVAGLALNPCVVFAFAGQTQFDKSQIPWPIGDLGDIVGVWGETQWTSTQLLGRSLSIEWYFFYDGVNGRNLAFQTGTSPVSMSFNRTKIDQQTEGLQNPPSECVPTQCTLRSTRYPASTNVVAPLSAGLVIQQRFTDYMSIFHLGELPANFTALPDS